MATKKKKELIEDITKEWIDFSWNNIGKEIDKESFEKEIKWLYKEYLKKPVPKIIYCDSPSDFILKEKKVKYLNDYSVVDMLKLTTGIIRSNIILRITSEIDKSLNILQLVLKKLHFSYIFPIWKGYCDIGWIEYFNQVGILKSPNFIRYKNLVQSRAFCICLFENIVFVIRFPTEIIETRTGSSIKFRDGDEYYFIRGVEIKKDLLKKIQDRSITLEEILKITNEEVKSGVLLMYQELYGEEATYQFISKSLREVDSYFHKTGDKTLCYTLFKGELGRGRIAYIRCYCPTTDRMFFLGVASRYTSAKDAIASLYRIPRRLKLHIKYINRQGERFTTVLTDTGERIRKKMTKENFEDLTIISGDDYFELMRYEY